MPRPKKEEEIIKCPICEGEMNVEYDCHMEHFLGRANWHMSFKPRLTMCKQCSDKLLLAVENWYKERNKTNHFNKWEIEEE